MFYIILITVLGINLAPFVFAKVDIWHAQGFFVQCMIAIMFAWSFYERPKYMGRKNLQLGLLFFWISCNTAFVCFLSLMNGKYNTTSFFPYFNFLCLLILYKSIVQYLNINDIKKIFSCIKYAVIATLLISTLQVFKLSQFFALTSTHHTHNNIVTGFLGNGTHLSGFLACCSPLFFSRKRLDILTLMLMVLVLMFTGTTIGDPSISGFLIIPILFFYLHKSKLKVILPATVLLICCILLVYKHLPLNFLSFQGRFVLWGKFLPLFKQYPITGASLGSVRLMSKYVYPNANNLHLEYLQFAFEIGIVGLVLILNLIYSFIKNKAKSHVQLVLKAMVLGFLLSCFFNFPAHLWLPSTYAMLAYAGLQIKE